MWYDTLYGNDPSTDNIFGREDLAPRQGTALLHHLRQGGAILDFARARRADLSALTAIAKGLPG